MTTHSGPVVRCAPWRKQTPTLRQLNRVMARTRKQRHEAARLNCLKLTGRETL